MSNPVPASDTAMPAFNLLDAAYSLTNGAQALRALRLQLIAHAGDEPLSALNRDNMIFILDAMAEKAATVADCVIDEIEMRNKRQRVAL